MKNINTKYKIGFTLVELLVVISIISILSSIVYASFGDARKSARDDIRKTDLKSMELAVRLYKAQNGRYPSACRGDNKWSGNVDGEYKCPTGTEYIVGLVPDYIAALPSDPKGVSGTGYIYAVSANGADYKILSIYVEKKYVTSYADEFARCDKSYGTLYCRNVPQRNAYAVYSAGSASW